MKQIRQPRVSFLRMPTLQFDVVLFDMDGTLVDSTAGVVGAWQTFAKTYPEIDVQRILSGAHGVRTVENLRKHCGIEDPEKLESEAERFEQAIVDACDNNGGIVCLPGAGEIIRLLSSSASKESWAICTSATRKYATAALRISGIPVPHVFVTAEDVVHGKPMPDPYLLGAKKCGADPRRCLVVEDAPAGVRSGQAAGCTILGVITSHSREEMEACKADYLVKDLSSVSMRLIDSGVEVTINVD